MRIDSMVYTNQVYGPKNARRSPYAAQTGQTKDALEISDFGNAYQVAKQAAKGTEPVREDRVKEIKANGSSASRLSHIGTFLKKCDYREAGDCVVNLRRKSCGQFDGRTDGDIDRGGKALCGADPDRGGQDESYR